MNIISFDDKIRNFNESIIDKKTTKVETKNSFSDIFNNAINTINEYQSEADEAATELAAGNSKDIHKTMIAIEKSSISLQLLIEIRNSVIDAYKELSRMQI